MVNRIKYTPKDDIVDYFKNVRKMSRPIECTSMVTQIAMNLGCQKMANLAYIEGNVQIILYPCCMVVRRSSYLTWPFDYILVNVLHYSLIGWERCTTASHDHLALGGELVWRQHSRS
jgi:hypothetical protein